MAQGGVYTVLFDTSGIGGHISFERDKTKVFDRDFAVEIQPNRRPAGLPPAALAANTGRN